MTRPGSPGLARGPPLGDKQRMPTPSRRVFNFSAGPAVLPVEVLAAFAIRGGHQLVKTDRGLRHFKGLDLRVLGRS